MRLLKNELKVSPENILKVSIKQAYKLGKGDDNKPPPFLIKFGHPSERNTILTHSKNLAGSKVEKHIPKNYQEKHKELKNLSWKLKTMPEMVYMTQIIFDSHIMVLRVRRKDTASEKFHWINHTSFEPPMDSKNTEKTAIKTPVGTKATPAPENTAVDKANSAFFMTLKGMTKIHATDAFKNKLVEYLNVDHKDMIFEVKMTRKPDLVIVYCNSWSSAKTIFTGFKN